MVTAAIFWAKTKMGWTEHRSTCSGGGERTKQPTGAVVILPDNGRGGVQVTPPAENDRILGRDYWRSNTNEGDVWPDEGDPEPDENG